MSQDPEIEYHKLSDHEKAQAEEKFTQFIRTMREQPQEARRLLITHIRGAFCLNCASEKGLSCRCEDDS